MKNDRVVIVDSLMFNDKEGNLPVYKPKTNPDGSFVTGYDGHVLLEQVGGVKVGSTGTIQGDSIKVNRSQLVHLKNQTTMTGTNDYEVVLPVFIDQYQLVGWLPASHTRVVG